ncbi:MAG TPA: glycosyltransferase family 2 protein [Flavobacterium sp.]|nr:glycosyltransferase family 2 protein [Flavobacterium sp.]
MNNPLVSIIIPTFNRAHLIGETLDSIIAQTYTNWECIVVDDGSTDNTEVLMNSYQQKDKRFKFHHRNSDKPKGANSCRNIGLDLAKGNYLVFFDSDDLMTPDHLEIKINSILKYKTDYVITKTKFFNSDKDLEKYYQFDKYDLTPYNYVSQKVNWLTLDICLKAEIGKSIEFNEKLKSGQEFNYYSKLVHKSVNAVFIDKVVSLRRHHEDSIRTNLKTKEEQRRGSFFKHWLTLKDIKEFSDIRTHRYLLRTSALSASDSKDFFGVSKVYFYKKLFKYFGASTLYYIAYRIIYFIFRRGSFLRIAFINSTNKRFF